MDEMTLQDILTLNYGIESPSLEFLREGGGHTYVVNGRENKYLLKVIGAAFSDTARQSMAIMRYLEENGFPVPQTILTKSGEAFCEAVAGDEKNYLRIAEYEELGERLWDKVKNLPRGKCHGDLHRGNLIRNAEGRIFLVDFDTVCNAPVMFDVMVTCDVTDYFRLKKKTSS